MPQFEIEMTGTTKYRVHIEATDEQTAIRQARIYVHDGSLIGYDTEVKTVDIEDVTPFKEDSDA